MIGFIDVFFVLSLLITIDAVLLLIYTLSSSPLHTHSVSTSHILAMNLNAGTITSNHYEVSLLFLLQSPWTADSSELEPIL
jgi:hypothetical protein